MKKIAFALLSVLLLAAFTVPKNKREVRCTKQSGKFVVDGKTTDWKANTLQFDKKTGFAYAFSNDDRSLFVQLKMLNANVQRKVLVTGLTLWIDPHGKGKRVLGIKYPLGRIHEPHARRKRGQRPSGRYGQRRPASGNHLTAEKISLFNKRYRSERAKLEGFDKAGIEANTGPGGIQVLLQMDTLGHVVYEAKIPLKMIFTRPADYLSKDKPFSVLLETGYLQIDMSRMQGRGGMGGRQGQGLGSGQRPNPSRMAFMQNMAEASHLKIKSVYLFQKK